MSKLIWHSNGPWTSTGYGQQTALFAPRVAEHYELVVSAFYGLEGSRLAHDNYVVFPCGGGTWGNEAIQGHAESFFGSLRGGLVVSLADVEVLDPAVWAKLNLAAWCPVDHDPATTMQERFFTQTGAVPIAMSRFGQDRLAEFDPLYCPHAVDTKAFRPVQGARKRLGLPESAFIVGAVVANKGIPSRKSIPELMEAFAALRQTHDDALLYLHTDMLGAHEGVNVPLLVEALKLPVDSVQYTPQYAYNFDPWPPEAMANLYSSFDVLLNPSKGEGFGLPVLEAQACGTPAIVTDFSAMPEVCGAGWHVEYDREWTFKLGFMAHPKLEDIVEALRHAYSMDQAARDQLAVKARGHAAQYDINLVVEHQMIPALKEAEERYEAQKPQVWKPKVAA